MFEQRECGRCSHDKVVAGSGKAAVERPEFRWVDTILGNVKNAMRGTYHVVRPKYAQRYLSEFKYRADRRFDLPDIIPRLVYVALKTPSMAERLLKFAQLDGKSGFRVNHRRRVQCLYQQ